MAVVATQEDFENLYQVAQNLGWDKMYAKRPMHHLHCQSAFGVGCNVHRTRKPPKERHHDNDPPFQHWKRPGVIFLLHLFVKTILYPGTRSDGALVVADNNKVEKVLGPPGSGATVLYRLGYYNACLPRTSHSEEQLNCSKLIKEVAIVLWLYYLIVCS